MIGFGQFMNYHQTRTNLQRQFHRLGEALFEIISQHQTIDNYFDIVFFIFFQQDRLIQGANFAIHPDP